MKYLLLLCLYFTGCSKEKKYCWECDVQCVTGPPFHERVCNDDTNSPQFQDASGGDCSEFCVKQW